jgi:hypothetical protein
MKNSTDTEREQQILQEKLTRRIESGRISAEPYLKQIEQTGKLINDFILPLGQNKLISFLPDKENHSKIEMHLSNGHEKIFGIHKHAVVQVADKLDVNSTYIKDLISVKEPWRIDLAAHVLEQHSINTPRKRVLVREVGGEVRGFLSDQFRRLDSNLIFGAFLSASSNTGAIVCSAYADATRYWIEVLFPQTFSVPTNKNGIITLAYGMRIGTSDFGDGALELRAFMIQVVCFNGMVRDSIIRAVHLGQQIPDNIRLSDKTYLLDSKTQASFVTDAVKQLMNKDSIMQQAVQIQQASDIVVDLDKEFKQLQKINRSGLSKTEVESLKKIITNNRTEDGVQGENTLWKLAQGVGAVARDTEDNRRKRELEQISGELFDRLKK